MNTQGDGKWQAVKITFFGSDLEPAYTEMWPEHNIDEVVAEICQGREVSGSMVRYVETADMGLNLKGDIRLYFDN